ncbi:MAG: hypothetical protein WC187_08935 [Bacillota bacterium]
MAQIQLSTKLNIVTWTKLDELVEKTGKSKATIVNEALEKLHKETFEKKKKGGKSSTTTKAGEYQNSRP